MLPIFRNLNVTNCRKTMAHGKDEPIAPLIVDKLCKKDELKN